MAAAIDRCRLVVTTRPARAPARRREIDAVWRRASIAQPSLFDGELLSVRELEISGRTLTLEAEVVRYREFIAQRDGLDLGVRPLGVTGVTRIGYGVLIGRRASHVTQYPGRWEPVPAGSVTPPGPDGAETALEDQLLAELQEESGIAPEWVTEIRIAGLVEDRADGVVDLCFALTADAAPSERAIARHAAGGEHAELRLCAIDEAHALARDESSTVPTMAPMLSLAARR